ncbi:MAG: alpha/beta fold hydrolase [Methanobacterium sp.]
MNGLMQMEKKKTTDEPTRTFVLVHGGDMSTDTWNKLAGREDYPPGGHLGARYWDGTINELESHKYCVFAPSLIDEYSGNLTDHINQICGVIEENKLRDIILVGHSYGGFVITGVADRMPERIGTLVYLDSVLPDPGQSLIDVLNTVYSKQDYKAALPDPNPPYVEKIQYDPKKLEGIKKIYIHCTNSEFIDATRPFKEKIAGQKSEWTYIELPSSHVPMADMPDEFYKLLLKIAQK